MQQGTMLQLATVPMEPMMMAQIRSAKVHFLLSQIYILWKILKIINFF